MLCLDRLLEAHQRAQSGSDLSSPSFRQLTSTSTSRYSFPHSHGSAPLGEARTRESLRFIFCEPAHVSLVSLMTSALKEDPRNPFTLKRETMAGVLSFKESAAQHCHIAWVLASTFPLPTPCLPASALTRVREHSSPARSVGNVTHPNLAAQVKAGQLYCSPRSETASCF